MYVNKKMFRVPINFNLQLEKLFLHPASNVKRYAALALLSLPYGHFFKRKIKKYFLPHPLHGKKEITNHSPLEAPKPLYSGYI